MAGKIRAVDVNVCKTEASYEDCVACVSKTNKKRGPLRQSNPSNVCTPTSDGKWSVVYGVEGISQYSLLGMTVGLHKNFDGFYIGPRVSINSTLSGKYEHTDQCPDTNSIFCGPPKTSSTGGAFAGAAIGKYIERDNLSYGVHANMFFGDFSLNSPGNGKLSDKNKMMYQLYADVSVRKADGNMLGDFGLYGGVNVFCDPLNDNCGASFLLGVKIVASFNSWAQ